MRQKLETELMNILFPYREGIPFEEVKAQITIILSNYDIEARRTELAVQDDEKNKRYLAMFLASKAAGGRTEKTLRAYKTYLRKILQTIGKNAVEVTADDVKLYLARKLRIDKNTKTAVDNERRALSTFYSWMQKNEHIAKNPMDKVEVMKFAKPKKYAFSDMEVEQIRSACATERERMVVEVLLSTWCRVSELCGIKLEEIAGDKVLVHGKGEKDRTVFLNAKAQIAIERYLEKRRDRNTYLLPRAARAGSIAAFSRGTKKCEQSRWYEEPELVDEQNHCDTGTIESMVRRLGARAGVKNVHPHRFRRTGATMAMRAGMPILTVSKLLGHANIAVTQVYLDINDEDLENEHGKYVR